MGFTGNSVIWRAAIYKEPESQILININLTETLQPERGTRQDCPCSLLLFNIAFEPLAQNIRENKDIKGVILGGGKHKVAFLQMVCVCVRASRSIPEVVGTIAAYGKLSGYQMNYYKSSALVFA